MTVGVALVGLMALDGGFSGFRAVAGRTGRVRLRGLAIRAGAAGAGLGGAAGGALLLAVWALGGPSADLVEVGRRLVAVYAALGWPSGSPRGPCRASMCAR